jgi:hypothetical protein
VTTQSQLIIIIIIIFKSRNSSTNLSEPIFTNLDNYEQHHEQISYSETHSNRTKKHGKQELKFTYATVVYGCFHLRQFSRNLCLVKRVFKDICSTQFIYI